MKRFLNFATNYGFLIAVLILSTFFIVSFNFCIIDTIIARGGFNQYFETNPFAACVFSSVFIFTTLYICFIFCVVWYIYNEMK